MPKRRNETQVPKDEAAERGLTQQTRNCSQTTRFEQDIKQIESRTQQTVLCALTEKIQLLRKNDIGKLKSKCITNISKHLVNIPSNLNLWKCKVTENYRHIYATNGELILLAVGTHSDLYK